MKINKYAVKILLMMMMINVPISANYGDANTDYTNTKVEIWKYDDTGFLSLPNKLLKALKSTRYESFLNKGPYQASISTEDKRNVSGDNLSQLTIDATRANNASPMYIKIWDEDGYITHFMVEEPPSEAYPLGKFSFRAQPIASDGAEEDWQLFVGTIDSKPHIQVLGDYIDDDGENNVSYTIIADNTTLQSGVGYLEQTKNGITNKSYTVFDSKYYGTKSIDIDGRETTEIKKKANPIKTIYKYKVFKEETGAEVKVNTDFTLENPIVFDTYTHSTANDKNNDSEFNNQDFNITYNGYDLSVPWEGNDTVGYSRKINLKAGVTLTSENTKYIVKPVEISLEMQTESNQSVLDIASSQFTVPTFTSIGNKKEQIPTGTTLKVIRGEIIAD